MFRKGIKNFLCTILVFVMIFSVLSVEPKPIYAADAYVNILHKVSTATANAPIDYNFSLSRKSDIYFIICTNERTGVTISVKEPDHDIPTASITLAETNPNWKYEPSNGIYRNTAKVKLNPGKYILELRFDIDVNFDMSMNQLSPVAKLNKTSTTITKGFTDTLKVDGGIIKTCSSSNKKVATVNNKGKITAKKNGKAKINVKLTNGKTLKCNVKVVSNRYKAKKITISSTIYNTYDMKAYDAQFDSKGNIVVKFKIVNNSYGQITDVPKFKINVKNSKNKVIATYSKNSYKVSVKGYGEKACTVTIPKSALKVKKNKVDLRTAKFSITGKFANASF